MDTQEQGLSTLTGLPCSSVASPSLSSVAFNLCLPNLLFSPRSCAAYECK